MTPDRKKKLRVSFLFFGNILLYYKRLIDARIIFHDHCIFMQFSFKLIFLPLFPIFNSVALFPLFCDSIVLFLSLKNSSKIEDNCLK